MKQFYELLCVIMLTAKASSNGIPVMRNPGAVTDTNVVGHSFCESSISAEDKMTKKRLEEVYGYAELKLDPRASLPDSFTICSTITTPTCANFAYPTFFTILDNKGAQLLAFASNQGAIDNLLKIFN